MTFTRESKIVFPSIRMAQNTGRFQHFVRKSTRRQVNELTKRSFAFYQLNLKILSIYRT